MKRKHCKDKTDRHKQTIRNSFFYIAVCRKKMVLVLFSAKGEQNEFDCNPSLRSD